MKNNFESVNVKSDGNCFYRTLSYLVTENECNHCSIRQNTADWIES